MSAGFLSSGSEATNNVPFPMARTHRHLSVGTIEVALFVNAFKVLKYGVILAHYASLVNNFCTMAINYSLLRWILPLMVLGRLSRNSTTRGYL